MNKTSLLESVLVAGGTERDGRVSFLDTAHPIPPMLSEEHARDRSRWTLFRLRNAEFLERVLAPLSSNLRLIDLGTGPNQFKPLLTRFTESLRVDFKAYQDVEVITDLSKALPFRDTSFDIVLSTNFLEHIPNPALSLQESFRMLRPDGWSIGIVPFLVGVHQRPYDFYRYTDIQLRALLTEAGFREIQIEPIGTARDAYDQLARQFYQRMIGSSEKKPLQRWVWRILWWMQRLLTISTTHLPLPHIDTPACYDYTLGYAWSARK